MDTTIKLHVLKMREIENLMRSCPEQAIDDCEYCTELLNIFKSLSQKFLNPGPFDSHTRLDSKVVAR